MSLDITANRFEGNEANCAYDRNPDECPLCHHHVEGRRYAGFLLKDEDQLQIIYRCPRISCSGMFIGYFRKSYSSRHSGSLYELKWTEPQSHQTTEYSPEINESSKSFVDIYDQSVAAEEKGLSEIAGMGLRKALEFLIKDFLILEKPDDAEAIRGKLLGRVIEEYVDDPRLKSSAKLASWLGNDETHYHRKWADHDINDLKSLIRLSVNWIESILIQKKLEESMTHKEIEPADSK